MAGFGNLRGNIELWDTESKKLMRTLKAPDTTHFEWCPDGVHFMTSTTAPRLRVGNGYVGDTPPLALPAVWVRMWSLLRPESKYAHV